MKRRSVGFINVDDSKNLEAFQSHTQENIKDKKKMKRLLTDDFSHFEKRNFKIQKELNLNEFRPITLNEMAKQTKLQFIESNSNSLIRRQDQQTVPLYKKQRDDQITQQQQFKSQIKKQIYKEDDVNQNVCIILIEAFIVIFIILIVTHLFLQKYLQ
ncbi:unnamed protein product [Paramecium primaurelia]|uniref:Transmembrane protein n=1 Tax=Paramecium primaurelia TaxID=5886 RepID=A0A8S1NIT7_PARPR|nr:unnamed protein product [Paramecium primaurelia]